LLLIFADILVLADLAETCPLTSPWITTAR